jgi:dihydrofolate synthase/folylpolyglutamate synthase
MDYEKTLAYLYHQLPMYQRVGAAAYKDNLDNTLALDEAFLHPHVNFKTIHVAGTNGKGSTSHMLASVLQSAGYKVGLYTSPHLKDFRERIKVNGQKIEEEAVVGFVDRYLSLNQHMKLEPSFFELTVIMAFDYFSSQKVDIAVVEVGLGGRLDSTNIINPELSVITNISFDHTNLLGNTLGKIAVEKAGIIKQGVPVVVGEFQPETQLVFQQKAEQENVPLLFADQVYSLIVSADGKLTVENQDAVLYPDLELGLKGDYQQKNILTVIASLDVLKRKGWEIKPQAVREGLANVVAQTGLLGRWQQLGDNPKIICDTGHNEAGIGYIVQQLKKEKFEKLHMVFGMVNDKSIDAVLQLLPRDAVYYFTKANIDRALNEELLQQQASNYGLIGDAFPSVELAFETAKQRASDNDFIFIGGSTFVVAEVV